MITLGIGVVIGLLLETYTGWGTKLRAWTGTW